MRLGNFSISLAVQDIQRSRAFYEKLGFRAIGGDIASTRGPTRQIELSRGNLARRGGGRAGVAGASLDPLMVTTPRSELWRFSAENGGFGDGPTCRVASR